MKKVLFVLAALFVTSVFVYAHTGIAGKWVGEAQAGRGGPQAVTVTISADMKSGTFTQGQQPEAKLSDIKLDGAKVTFSRDSGRSFNGVPITIDYTGELKGDELTLNVDGGGGGGGGGRGGAGGGGPMVLKRAN